MSSSHVEFVYISLERVGFCIFKNVFEYYVSRDKAIIVVVVVLTLLRKCSREVIGNREESIVHVIVNPFDVLT